jgi:hypothetical protein
MRGLLSALFFTGMRVLTGYKHRYPNWRICGFWRQFGEGSLNKGTVRQKVNQARYILRRCALLQLSRRSDSQINIRDASKRIHDTLPLRVIHDS